MSKDVLAEAPVRTQLEDRLTTLIAENGPISIADYMSDALGHPQHGYYTTQDPFGQSGDFTTSPEISQVFGELVGAWLIDAWMTMGSPSWFQLVELGPGRGTLMSDILRVAALRPAFLEAMRITLVETSGRLRVRQQAALSKYSDKIKWVDTLEKVEAGPILMVANEFFDCLPIRQFVRTAADSETPWRERMVGVAGAGPEQQLCYVLSDEEYAAPAGSPSGAQPETLFEVCEAGASMVTDIAARLKEHKGRALIIDYGHGRSGFGDTFQAVKRHDVWHPLASPGLADITAHVDFGALARAGRDAEIRVDGPVRQGDFLSRLGLIQRVEALAKTANSDPERADVESAALRLVSPDGMGTLFKVMALSSADMPAPPGFL